MEDNKVVLIEVVYLDFGKGIFVPSWDLYAFFLIYRFIRGPPPLIINLKI